MCAGMTKFLNYKEIKKCTCHQENYRETLWFYQADCERQLI